MAADTAINNDTAKAAQKSAQAAAKASHRAAQAARAAAKATAAGIKAAAKATAAAVKAIIAATKALVAAIAAGGWIAVAVIVIICLIGLIVGSCFGIFFSGEDTGTGQTMQTVVREINEDYENQLDTIKANISYDVLEMSGSRAVWPEVLSVYAVKTTTDPDNAMDVATVDDARKAIASMLLSDAGLKPYTDTAYHNEELKSLTRYRFDKVKERAKLKSSIARLVCILFPELEKLVPSLHIASVYALLEEFPGAKQIASAHLTRLKALLVTASKGRYNRDMAFEIRDAARNSIGSRMPAKSLELQHTIRLIRELDDEIEEIEEQIHSIMDELHSPITTIPGLGFRMAAMILAEVGDFTRFDSPDKLLAYAGMSPSTYQSGQLKNCYPHMEKRGSRYLRYALYNAAKYVCQWDPTFSAYLAKKRAEGKHYNVAISHAVKKLVRLIFAMEKSGVPYLLAA